MSDAPVRKAELDRYRHAREAGYYLHYSETAEAWCGNPWVVRHEADMLGSTVMLYRKAAPTLSYETRREAWAAAHAHKLASKAWRRQDGRCIEIGRMRRLAKQEGYSIRQDGTLWVLRGPDGIETVHRTPAGCWQLAFASLRELTHVERVTPLERIRKRQERERRERYEQAEQLRRMMHDIGWSCQVLARRLGTYRERVYQWTRPERPIRIPDGVLDWVSSVARLATSNPPPSIPRAG